MTSIQVKPSPEGVPGAVTDPSRDPRRGAHATRAPAATQVNGYLARPAEPAGTPPGDDRDPRGGRPRRAHPRRRQPLRQHRLRRARRRPVHARRRPAADGRHAGDDGAPVLDVRRDACSATSRAPPTSCARARTSTGKVGCIGFCMGGRYTLLFACASDRLDAAVDCWGGFIDRATPDERSTPERPTPPLELADRLRCPLLAAVGAEDQNPSPELGEQLRERAAASGQEVEGRRLRGRRPRVLRRLPPHLPARAGGAAVGARSCRSSRGTCGERLTARRDGAARRRGSYSAGAFI